MKGDDVFEGLIALIFVVVAVAGAIGFGHFIYLLIKSFL